MDARISAVLKGLKKAYPEADCALRHKNTFELLMATILSAQTTDVRVNMVTPELFKKYPDAKALSKAALPDVEQIIMSTGFFRQKAKSLVVSARTLVEKFNGAVPRRMEDLLELRGVARKTANVVLGTGYGLATGVVVDTHVRRLSNRLGFTKNQDPVKIERDLVKKVPPASWIWLSHALIHHGRTVCYAQKPRCPDCFLLRHCPYGQKVVA